MKIKEVQFALAAAITMTTVFLIKFTIFTFGCKQLLIFRNMVKQCPFGRFFLATNPIYAYIFGSLMIFAITFVTVWYFAWIYNKLIKK